MTFLIRYTVGFNFIQETASTKTSHSLFYFLWFPVKMGKAAEFSISLAFCQLDVVPKHVALREKSVGAFLKRFYKGRAYKQLIVPSGGGSCATIWHESRLLLGPMSTGQLRVIECQFPGKDISELA